MQERALKMIEEMQEEYNIPYDQKIRFGHDILDIIGTYYDGLRIISDEETPSDQIDRENFKPLH